MKIFVIRKYFLLWHFCKIV